MRLLVLAAPSDETAVRVALLLRQRHGAERVPLCTGEEIVLAHWEHRISSSGVDTIIRLHDGALLAGSKRTVIFNRLSTIEAPMFAGASRADYEYARMEMFALLLSWLADPQCRVINRPSSISLTGAAYRPLIWQSLAFRAGLGGLGLAATSSTRRFPPTLGAVPRPEIPGVSDPFGYLRTNNFSWHSEPIPNRRMSVLVIGERVIGDIPETIAECCRHLAKLAGLDLLRVDLAVTDGSPANFVFVGAEPMPAITEPATLLSVVEFLETAALPDLDGDVR